MKDHDFFATTSVFTHEEYARSVSGVNRKSRRTVDSQLYYHLRAGHLIRIRRGLYAVVPRGVLAEKALVDPYLVASKLAEDAVIAYHTALEFHGQAYSVHYRFVYLTSHEPQPLEFQGHTFVGVRFPKALRDAGREMVGVKTHDLWARGIRVTTLERTLVDALHRPDLTGGWEEVWRSLESVEFFKLDQVVEYALLLGNATTIAKVGFFLEQHQEELRVEERDLGRLRSFRPKGPTCLKRGERQPVRMVPNWNIVVPEALVERSWEEPLW